MVIGASILGVGKLPIGACRCWHLAANRRRGTSRTVFRIVVSGSAWLTAPYGGPIGVVAQAVELLVVGVRRCFLIGNRGVAAKLPPIALFLVEPTGRSG
jgi:hypothetical protein